MVCYLGFSSTALWFSLWSRVRTNGSSQVLWLLLSPTLVLPLFMPVYWRGVVLLPERQTHLRSWEY